MRFIGLFEVLESALKEWIQTLRYEHSRYYGAPHGSFGAWGFKSPKDIRGLIDPYGVPTSRLHAGAEGNDAALRALGAVLTGFAHSELGGMWVTRGRNVIAAWVAPQRDEAYVLADGARHGIPWPPFVSDEAVIEVYLYQTNRPDRAPWDTGLDPVPPKGVQCWNPTRGDR
ncbi:hypothetical protein D6779_11375 [Candidatus Parcubacteria bacterium]|nr:MAG: hypothetical protein D6779_11375 [Candidatus Parcubacteria bacterium]